MAKNRKNPGIRNGRPCKVCDSAQRENVDLALAQGKSARFAAQSFGISVYAIQRHRVGHLRPGLAKAAASREELTAQSLLDKLQSYLQRLETGMDSAEGKSDMVALSRLVKEAAAIVVRLGQSAHGLWQPASTNYTTIDARRQNLNIFDGKDLDELRALRQSLTMLGTGEEMPATNT